MLLETEFDVVATVADGHALLRAADDARADVIVTDIVMLGLDGIAATVALCARRPALAFVLKHRAGDERVPAVRAALRG